MHRFVESLKRQAEEQPLWALAAAGVLLSSISKLSNAKTARMSARTHAREVKRRERNSRR